MNDLKSSLAAYNEAVEFLKKDPNNFPYAVRTGHQVRYNQYQQSLPALYKSVEEALLAVAYGFLPVGPAASVKAWLTAAAEEVSNSLSVDSMKLYKDLDSERLWASMGVMRRVFDSTQFAILDDELRTYLSKYHFDDVRYADYRVLPFLTDRNQVVGMVQNILETQFGLAYRTAVLRGSIVDAAIADPDLKTTSVVVLVDGVPTATDAVAIASLVFQPNRFSIVPVTEDFAALSAKEIRQRVLTDVKEAQKRLKSIKDNQNS